MKPIANRIRAWLKISFVLPLIFWALASPALVVMARSPGKFTATSNMTTPRYGHTATLLADGRVLIAGGGMIASAQPHLVFKTLASAEIYDPVMGTFTATGNMVIPRSNHTATLLPDGKILITGGAPNSEGIGSSPASAELYDPSTGTFTATGEMTEARSYHTATLLRNGQVLIAGGFQVLAGNASRFLASAELYDPSSGSFTATGNMTEPSSDTATLLADGKVLITRSIVFTPEET